MEGSFGQVNGVQLYERMTLSASKKCRNRVATIQSVRNSFWNKSGFVKRKLFTKHLLIIDDFQSNILLVGLFYENLYFDLLGIGHHQTVEKLVKRRRQNVNVKTSLKVARALVSRSSPSHTDHRLGDTMFTMWRSPLKLDLKGFPHCGRISYLPLLRWTIYPTRIIFCNSGHGLRCLTSPISYLPWISGVV